MDLAKEKHGGPFTTEQIEDVKGISSISLSFGSVLQQIQHIILYKFSWIIHTIDTRYLRDGIFMHCLLILFLVGCLKLYYSSLPDMYPSTFHPFYIPGMLKRIGLGMTIWLLSLHAAPQPSLLTWTKEIYFCKLEC